MFNKDLLLSVSTKVKPKPEKHKKLWSRFKITIGTGQEPSFGSSWTVTGWAKNSGGYGGNFGSYSHVSAVHFPF